MLITFAVSCLCLCEP